MLSLSFVQYLLVQHLAVCCCWTLLLAAVRICRFFSSGDDLFSAGTMHVTPMTESHLGRLDLSQPCAFKDLFPKVERAVLCMVRKVSHLSVQSYQVLRHLVPSGKPRQTAMCSTKSSWRILLTLSLILQHLNEFSMLQFALWKDHVWRTLFRSSWLTRIRYSWYQCSERICLQETLSWGLVLKQVLVIHRSW